MGGFHNSPNEDQVDTVGSNLRKSSDCMLRSKLNEVKKYIETEKFSWEELHELQDSMHALILKIVAEAANG